MAVPKFEQFLYPFLLLLKDGDLTTSQITEKLSSYFKLSEEDQNIRTKGGNITQLKDRINWTRQYFRRALFIDIPHQGTYRITQRGLDFLKNHNSLTIDDLMEYPEYAAFNTSHRKKNDDVKPKDSIVELTPTEQLEQAYESISNDLATDLLTKVINQTPQFFEQLVVDLLLKMGYGNSSTSTATVTQFVHDDGIDGIISEDKLGLDKIYIQAKRYTFGNTVGKPQIQQFAGALDEKRANKGVFITTSTYSKEARTFVEKASKKIVLIDGEELARYMMEYNVGVSVKKVYEVKRIDSDYFEQ